jgi:hypothetical protein
MNVSAYAYALNNPIANGDPNGLSPGAAGFYFTPWSAAAAAATAGWGAAAAGVGATAAGAGVVAGVFAAANAGIGMFHDTPADRDTRRRFGCLSRSPYMG